MPDSLASQIRAYMDSLNARYVEVMQEIATSKNELASLEERATELQQAWQAFDEASKYLSKHEET